MSYTLGDALKEISALVAEYGADVPFRIVLNQYSPMEYEISTMAVVDANAVDNDLPEEEFTRCQQRYNQLKATFDRSRAQDNELDELAEILGFTAPAGEEEMDMNMVAYLRTGSQIGYTSTPVNQALGAGGRDA